MANPRDFNTGSTLFNFLAEPGDRDRWAAFELRYRPLIRLCCRDRNIQDADVEDLASDVLLALYQKMAVGSGIKFDATRPFRPWFKTVVANEITNFYRKRRPGTSDGDTSPSETAVAPERVSVEFERGLERAVLAEALEDVRSDVSSRDYAVFIALEIDGRTGEQVAAEHGLKRAHVYVVRQRVKEKLAAIIRRKDPDLADKYQGPARPGTGTTETPT